MDEYLREEQEVATNLVEGLNRKKNIDEITPDDIKSGFYVETIKYFLDTDIEPASPTFASSFENNLRRYLSSNYMLFFTAMANDIDKTRYAVTHEENANASEKERKLQKLEKFHRIIYDANENKIVEGYVNSANKKDRLKQELKDGIRSEEVTEFLLLQEDIYDKYYDISRINNKTRYEKTKIETQIEIIKIKKELGTISDEKSYELLKKLNVASEKLLIESEMSKLEIVIEQAKLNIQVEEMRKEQNSEFLKVQHDRIAGAKSRIAAYSEKLESTAKEESKLSPNEMEKQDLNNKFFEISDKMKEVRFSQTLDQKEKTYQLALLELEEARVQNDMDSLENRIKDQENTAAWKLYQSECQEKIARGEPVDSKEFSRRAEDYKTTHRVNDVKSSVDYFSGERNLRDLEEKIVQISFNQGRISEEEKDKQLRTISSNKSENDRDIEDFMEQLEGELISRQKFVLKVKRDNGEITQADFMEQSDALDNSKNSEPQIQDAMGQK